MTSRDSPESNTVMSQINLHFTALGWCDVAVTNANEQNSAALSKKTKSRLLPQRKLNVVSRTSTTNEGPEVMQLHCNTNEEQKAMFSHPATDEGPKQTFVDDCTSERPQAAHSAELGARTELRLQQRRTAVSVMRKQHLYTMGSHSGFKRNTRGVSCPVEGNTELSTYPQNYDYVLYVWS